MSVCLSVPTCGLKTCLITACDIASEDRTTSSLAM